VTVGSDNPGPGVLEDIELFNTIVSNLHKDIRPTAAVRERAPNSGVANR
jgi:hypothetical protein